MAMTNKRIVLTVSAILILTIIVAGIQVYAQAQYENGYDTGRSEGYDVGHEEGYNEGLEKGYSEGYGNGYDEG